MNHLCGVIAGVYLFMTGLLILVGGALGLRALIDKIEADEATGIVTALPVALGTWILVATLLAWLVAITLAVRGIPVQATLNKVYSVSAKVARVDMRTKESRS